jgi:excisionase family DNA binding protein
LVEGNMSEPAFALPHEPLLTLDEVADRLAVSTRTVQRLVAGGELKPFYIGAAPRFDPREVLEYLEQTRSRPRRRRSAPRPRLIEGGRSFVDRLPRKNS